MSKPVPCACGWTTEDRCGTERVEDLAMADICSAVTWERLDEKRAEELARRERAAGLATADQNEGEQK